MKEIKSFALSTLLIVAFLTSTFVTLDGTFTASGAPSNIPPATNLPPYLIIYDNASSSVTLSIPSIGNITTMVVLADHDVLNPGGTAADLLKVILSSPRAKGPVIVSITNGPDGEVSDDKAILNGTSTYTIINGIVTINNIFQVSSTELVIQRNGTHMTVDFNPASPLTITLPPALFPPENFSATWTLPAFHEDINGFGTESVSSPLNTIVYPSGWTTIVDAASYQANTTFTCPSWNNYSTSATGTLSDFSTLRLINPVAVPFSLGIPARTMDYYTGGVATVTFPQLGNITTMTIDALHVVQSDHIATTDVLSMTLTGPLAKGNITASIAANPTSPPPGNASSTWIYAIRNGTNQYTEVNGNVVINNIFNVETNELEVHRNGTSVSVDFNPAKPVVITLDPATFPPANFPSTWTIPAFHMTIYGQGSPVLASPVTATEPSGWSLQVYEALWPGNATFTCPTWNNYTTTISGTVLPLMVYSTQVPSLSVSAMPISSSVLAGGTATFTASVSGGVPPYTYQWYQGPNRLTGQTNPQLQLTTSTTNAGGQFPYYCQVTDSEAVGNQPLNVTANSNTVTLTVATLPTPTLSPTTRPTPSPPPSPSPTPTLASSTSAPTTPPQSPSPTPTPAPTQFTLSTTTATIIIAAVIVVITASAAVVLRRRPKL